MLVEARLRLVQAQRRRPPDRGAQVRGVLALLVQPVAGLVDRREHAHGQEALVDPRGQAHVRGARAAGEGVARDVLAAGVEVEAELAQHLQREVPLRFARVVLAHDGVVRPRGVEHAPREGHELRPQAVQQRLELGRRHARLEGVEHGVVALVALLQRVGLLDLERDHLLELGPVDVEVAVLPRLLPGRVRARALRRQRAHELRGQAHGAVAVVLDDAHHGAVLPAEAVGRVRQLVDDLAVRAVDHALVDEGRQGRLLERPRVVSALRAVRLLVPHEELPHSLEVTDLAHAALERVPGRCTGHATHPTRLVLPRGGG